jgi:NAD-dependent DNA ligase
MTTFNHEVGEKLREIAALLEAQHANPFRSRAYHNAANTLDNLPMNVAELVQAKGIKGLTDLPAIGPGIARSIYEYVAINRMTRLENLRGGSDPIGLFQSIPTVGPALAQRIHDTLHVDTLESLENATRNGRLDHVEGLGTKRKEAIEAWLLKHLGEHRQQLRRAQHSSTNPAIALLLKVDTEYRKKAEAGKLPCITPKRFNLENKAWLPILHSTRDHWHFTALYSNSERAHKLDRVHDWVVIYFYDDHHQEGQHTIVTETHGTLFGKRVVRGRESECHQYYESN